MANIHIAMIELQEKVADLEKRLATVEEFIAMRIAPPHEQPRDRGGRPRKDGVT